MQSIFLLSIALFCALSSAHAAPAVLSGTVADPSGARVPGARIQLAMNGSDAAVLIVTDHDGTFRASNLAPGTYGISVESAGFGTFTRTGLKLASGESKLLDISLAISSLSEQVTITAKAPAGEGAIETSSRNSHEVLEIREVRESGAKDVGEALTSLDGISKIRKAGIANDIVLRGFQQGNLNFLIDGLRINGACPSHMDPSASHIDFSEIEDVEVTKGPFDIRNQGSLGGTVNVITKRQPDGFYLTPSFSTGSFGFVNPSLVTSLSVWRFHLLGGYSYRRSDPFVDGSGRNVTSYGMYTLAGRNNPAFDIGTGWGSLGFDVAHNQSVELSFTHQDGGLTLYPSLMMDAPYDRADRLAANWSLRELKGLVKRVRAQGYFSRVKHWMTDELRMGAVGAPLGFSMGTFASTKNFGGRLEAELAHTIVGAEAYDRGWDTVGSMRMGMMYSASHSLPDARNVVGGFYTQHRQNFGRLTVTLGGRMDTSSSAALARDVNTDLYWAYHATRSTSTSDLAPSGTISATYLLPKGAELFAGVGSTVRLPDPEERYYAVKKMGSDWVGNPLLAPTRNNEADLGLNVRGKHFTLRPTLFYSRLDNFIAIDMRMKINPLMSVMNPSARTYDNVDARMYGGEVAYSVGFTRSLLLSGGVSYTRGIQYAKPTAGLAKADMAEMPPFRSRASLRYGRSLFFAEINALAVARQDRIDLALQEQPTAGYALLGVKAGIHHKQWNIAAGIDNLTDRFYYEHLSYQRDPYRSGVRMPEPGRTLFLNISRTFKLRAD